MNRNFESLKQGIKDDGNRSIADKIIKRLHDLELSVESNQGRWGWELIQNAKDSVVEEDRNVFVQIELSEDLLKFSHNGAHFTEKDIRGLINQISSKEVEEGEERKKTGRFGTGFLTTHLLSKKVNVSGIVQMKNGVFYNFDFPLNRKGKTTSELVPRIKSAWDEFFISLEEEDEFDELEFNTSFSYKLKTESQKEVARQGLEEFEKLLPYVLVFVPEIEKVEIYDEVEEREVIYETIKRDNELRLVTINSSINEEKEVIKILYEKDEELWIATELEEDEEGNLSIIPKDKIPKIFCDFPLIGTESFHFPVVINSFDFTPLTERDGVWLKGNDDKKEVRYNKDCFEESVELIKKMIDNAIEQEISCLYHFALTRKPNTDDRYFDFRWFEENVQKPIRKLVIDSAIVETEENGNKKISDVRFPDKALKKEQREKIWQYSTALNVNELPKLSHIHKWADIIWKDCDLVDIKDLTTDLAGKKNLKELSKCLELEEKESCDWLNEVYEFIIEVEESIMQFKNNALLPNQDGDFKKRKDLYIDEIEHEELKEILMLLGVDWYQKLLHQDIYFTDCAGTMEIEDIAIEITKAVTSKDRKSDDDISAIRQLTRWFDENPQLGKEHFEKLFRNKEKNLVDTIQDKKSLYKIMNSKTPLSELSDVASAMENDPEINRLIKKRLEEIRETKEKTEVGIKIEEILAEALRDYGIEVERVWVGKDLIIKLSDSDLRFDIEVKSTNKVMPVSMTPTQAKTAANNPDSYSLCVIHKEMGENINKRYVKENATFVTDIGELIKAKVNEVEEFEENKRTISNTNEEIDLLFENILEYKYRVSDDIWSEGIDLEEFVELIKEEIEK